MIYLDYSATTKVDKSVLNRFNEIESNYYANPNSKHKWGLDSKKIIDDAINNIANLLNVEPSEIIFTSGASESNNTAIFGVSEKYDIKHIITTEFEHNSVLSPVSVMQNKGIEVSFVNVLRNGLIDLKHLESLIDDRETLVTIGCVNSEIGILQDINEIGLFLKKYNNVIFHSDITQAIGKVNVDLTNVDLASFSAHKFYAFKGIGVLIKKIEIKLNPLIYGGKSTTIYRAGTPQTGLIDAISFALTNIIPNVVEYYEYVSELNNKIREHLVKYDIIHVNSPINAIPHILNFSIKGHNSNDIQDYFANNDIVISTKTACSNNQDKSLSVFVLTGDEEVSKSSVRISLSYKTTEEEINEFLNILDKYLEEK